jgi:hypothetical protein
MPKRFPEPSFQVLIVARQPLGHDTAADRIAELLEALTEDVLSRVELFTMPGLPGKVFDTLPVLGHFSPTEKITGRSLCEYLGNMIYSDEAQRVYATEYFSRHRRLHPCGALEADRPCAELSGSGTVLAVSSASRRINRQKRSRVVSRPTNCILGSWRARRCAIFVPIMVAQ